ncbi:methyltransferase domain-containing protein [Sphingobium sufflavum]|uniref:class I SAM-dependent methyltransferase n=1 Tax=Sphingobium sufflavum TaxID=1129547 RepID=UPI001F394DE0|nr:methyltransferase domain-containing protein [Sphingobium sufflavum]MCE7798771.1 methyltransferase domain-containing protein [Sphingobium sufflavum]
MDKSDRASRPNDARNDGRPTLPAAALLFFRQFLASPKSVGSIIPTSQAAIDALLDPIDWSACRTFVEYGPGTGVFTRSILARAHPDLLLIAIDPNPVFVEHLRTRMPDPRLKAVEGSAADVEAILAAHGRTQADYILSGLPFSTLPPGVGETIIAATERAVAPGGAFLVYQYSLFVLPWLKARFARVDVGREWRCIPPARLMRARKPAGADIVEERAVSAAHS